MERLTLRFIIISACVIVIVWAIGGAAVYFLRPEADRAAFGEMFGAVNALFSGLAFAGVICAILLQREDLSLQRTELQLTREQHTASAEANRAAAKSLADQARLQLRSAQLDALTAQLESCSSQINQLYQRYQAYATKTSGAELPDTRQLEAKRAQVEARISSVLSEIEADLSEKT
jgi:hypothetical protein